MVAAEEIRALRQAERTALRTKLPDDRRAVLIHMQCSAIDIGQDKTDAAAISFGQITGVIDILFVLNRLVIWRGEIAVGRIVIFERFQRKGESEGRLIVKRGVIYPLHFLPVGLRDHEYALTQLKGLTA